MKKKILSKTILFLEVLIFVITFKILFGEENTLIGVTTITAMLMFLELDLTLTPVKNTIKLVALNLFIGVATFIASTNMYIAIPINFISIFIMSYLLSFNLKKPMYLPFSLQYLFLLTAPVDISLQPKRLFSLVIGAISIMILQLIFNRNKVTKVGKKLLISICDDILIKINLMKNSKNVSDLAREIQIKLTSFRNIIYEKRDTSFYLTEEGRISLNISMALEKISICLNKTYCDEDEKIVDFLRTFLEGFKEAIEHKSDQDKLENFINSFLKSCSESELNNTYYMNIINNLFLLAESINELESLGKKHYNRIERVENIPEDYKKSKVMLRELRRNSLKFCYSIRIALGISIGAFIINYFNFSEGRWLLFTLLSVVNPIYEVAKEKSKDRVVATIIGSIIIVILFTIFRDITIRTLIIMGAGYIGSYTSKYKHNMICVSVSAIGSAAIMDKVEVMSINRIFFVVIGVIIAMILNRWVLPYKLEDSNEYLKTTYDKVIYEMLKCIYDFTKGGTIKHRIKNLLLITSVIEDRLRINNQVSTKGYNEEYIKEHRILVNNLYELYILIHRYKIGKDELEYIIEDIKKIVNYDRDNNKEVLKSIKDNYKNTINTNDKIIFNLLSEIVNDLWKIKAVSE